MSFPAFALTWAYLAAAIVLDATGLAVWDIGTRSPARLVRDLRSGSQDRAAVARAGLRLCTGALAIFSAAAIGAAVTRRVFDASIVDTAAMIVALVVEGLVGPVVRTAGRLGRR